jgi:hypothetical protein
MLREKMTDSMVELLEFKLQLVLRGKLKLELQRCCQVANHTSRKPSSVKSGTTAEISGSFAAINFA